jgi:hypothetical protein
MAQTSGVLAIEFAPPAPARPLVLPTHEASLLLEAIAADLARLAPDATRCDLVAAGALYDAAQLLRPGWPIEAELARLRGGLGASASGQVTVFGAAGDAMPSARLEPEPALAGGPMRFLPWLLLGEPEAVAAAAANMERRFEDEGLAGAAVNLFLRQSLGREVAHARYLTRNDLMALTALQLDHAGLGPVWTILETALLAPGEGIVVELPHGGSLAFADGRVAGRIAGLGAHRVAAASAAEAAEAAEAFARMLGFQRGAAALLAAHGLPSQWQLAASAWPGLVEHGGADVAAPWPEGARLTRLAHPALGVAGLAIEDPASGLVECRWPLAREALVAMLAAADSDATAGRARLDTKTLAEWASALPGP